MAEYDDDTPPPGHRWHYYGDPSRDQVSGRYAVPIETPVDGTTPNRDVLGTTAAPSLPTAAPESQPAPATGIAPHRPVAGEVPGGPTPEPTLDQMRYELARKNLTPADWLMGGAENVASILTGLPGMLGGYAGLAYHALRGAPFKEANQKAADWAQASSYQPTTLAGREIAEDYVHPVLSRLPPVISGIMPGLMRPPRGTVGALGQGIKRDVGQFSNDFYNAQHGITPGYPTLGGAAAGALETARPLVNAYESGQIPGVPSPNMYAVNPFGKGQTGFELGKPFPSIENESGMARALGDVYRRVGPQNALDIWDNSVQRLGNYGQYTQFSNGYRDLVLLRGVLDPITGDKTPGTSDMDVVKVADEYTRLWNEQHRARPELQIQPPGQEIAKAKAINDWYAGPRKKYIETKLGTGVATDPILAQIEKTKFGLQQEVANYDVQSVIDEGTKARSEAAALYGADPKSDLSKYPMIGTQTAVTPAGKQFEDLADAYTAPQSLQTGYPVRYATPEQLKYLTQTTPIRDINPYRPNPLRNIDLKLEKEVIEGRIKPENIAQIGPERIALQLWKEEQERRALEKKSNTAYKTFRKALATDLPGEILPNGNKLVIFDKALTDKIGESMMVRGLSIDTYDLDHCVAQCGKPPETAGDIGWDTDPFKGRRYRPMLVPHTGEPPIEADYRGLTRPDPTAGRIHGHTEFTDNVAKGRTRIATLRDPEGEALVTTQTTVPNASGDFDVLQIMGYKDRGVDGNGPTNSGKKAITPEAAKDMTAWLNQNADHIIAVAQSYGLDHLKIMDQTKSGSGASNLGQVNPNFDYLRIKQIIAEYDIGQQTLGQPVAPRFLDTDALKTIVSSSSISPYELPVISWTNYSDNIVTLDNRIRKFDKLRNEIVAGTDTSNTLSAVERYLDTLHAMRDEQTVLLDKQLAQRRAGFAVLDSALSDSLSKLTASNITDPNFSFRLTNVVPEYRTIAHALAGDVYSPSSQLPIGLHKTLIDFVLSKSLAQITDLRRAVYDPVSFQTQLSDWGLGDVLQLRQEQLRNLQSITNNAESLIADHLDLVVPDDTFYFASPEDIVGSRAHRNNEQIEDTTQVLENKISEYQANPNPNTIADARGAARDFRMASTPTISKYLDVLNQSTTPADFNVSAFINDRVHPDIRKDLQIITKLTTNLIDPNLTADPAYILDPQVGAFARAYADDMSDAMYSQKRMIDLYTKMLQTDKYSPFISENGKTVLREYAKERLLPEDFNKFIAETNTLDATQRAYSSRYDIPDYENIPKFMRQEIFANKTDFLQTELADIRKAANQLRADDMRTTDQFFRNAAPYQSLNTKSQSALLALVGDPNVSLSSDIRFKLNNVLFDPYITYGDVNNYMSRLFDDASSNYVIDTAKRAKILIIMNNFMKLRGIDLTRATNDFLTHPDQQGYVPPPVIPNMAKGGRVRRMEDGGQASKEDTTAPFADNIDQMRHDLTKKNSGPVWDETGKQIDPNTGKPIQTPFQFDMANRSTVLPIKHRADADWQKSVMAKHEEKGWDWALPGMLASPINALNRGLRDPNVVDANEVAMSIMGGGLGLSGIRPAPTGSIGMATRAELLGSKIATGEPINLDLFHGSPTKGIQSFDSRAKPSSSVDQADTGLGVLWATPNRKLAEEYSAGRTMENQFPVSQGGKKIGEVYSINADLKNPLVLWNDRILPWNKNQTMHIDNPYTRKFAIEYAQNNGYDSVIFAKKTGNKRILSDYEVAILPNDKGGAPVSIRVPSFNQGGAVTDTLDKIVKNPQASQMLNLDLPNLIAAKRQAQPLKRGGKVQFTNNVDSMRRALGRH